MAVALALVGAIFSAVGFVVQQHAAAEEPPEDRLSFRLLAHLIRRPIWLAGIGAMVVGQLFGAVALNFGSLALVEPIGAANLLFALPLAARWSRRRLSWREWLGAGAVVAGIVTFIAAGHPYGGNTVRLPWPNWAIAGSVIALVVGVLVFFARRRSDVTEATMLGSAAGILFGLQDALTSRVDAQFGHGLVSALITWPVFVLVAISIVAILIGQSAFESAPLSVSLPPMTVGEPLTGIAFGVGVYGEHLNLSGPLAVLEMCGIVAMVVGLVMVARSPVVSGARHVRDEEVLDEAA